MKPPPHKCPRCEAGVDECVVDRYEPHPCVHEGPELAIYACRECGHAGRTTHPDLGRAACAERDRAKVRALQGR